MDKDLYDDLIQSLSEAVSYAQGDKTKGRSVVVSAPDDRLEAEHVFFSNFTKLPDASKKKVMQYTNELLQAVNS